MTFFNGRWQDLNGKPITGRSPPGLVVEGENQLTPGQYSELAHRYKLFYDQVGSSSFPKGYHVRRGRLSDGSPWMMQSSNDVVTVRVRPVPGGELQPPFHGIGIAFTDQDDAFIDGWKLTKADLSEAPVPVIVRNQKPGVWSARPVTKLLGGNSVWVDKSRRKWLSVYTEAHDLRNYIKVRRTNPTPIAQSMNTEWMYGLERVTLFYDYAASGYGIGTSSYIFHGNRTRMLKQEQGLGPAFILDGKMAVLEYVSNTEIKLYVGKARNIPDINLKITPDPGDLLVCDPPEDNVPFVIAPPSGYRWATGTSGITVSADGKTAAAQIVKLSGFAAPSYGEITITPSKDGAASATAAVKFITYPADAGAVPAATRTHNGNRTYVYHATKNTPSLWIEDVSYNGTDTYTESRTYSNVRSYSPMLPFYAHDGKLATGYQQDVASGTLNWELFVTDASNTISGTLNFTESSNSVTTLVYPKRQLVTDSNSFNTLVTGTASGTVGGTSTSTSTVVMSASRTKRTQLFYDPVLDVSVCYLSTLSATYNTERTGTARAMDTLNGTAITHTHSLVLEVVVGSKVTTYPVPYASSSHSATIITSQIGSGSTSLYSHYDYINHISPSSFAGVSSSTSQEDGGDYWINTETSSWTSAHPYDVYAHISLSSSAPSSYTEINMARDAYTMGLALHIDAKLSAWNATLSDKSWFLLIDKSGVTELRDVLNAAKKNIPGYTPIPETTRLKVWKEAVVQSLVTI